MKAARLATTNPGTGAKAPAEEVVLVCTLEEARIMFDALDLYCTANPASAPARVMYHTFGWGGELLPDRSDTQRALL